jgi:hypothetical protein
LERLAEAVWVFGDCFEDVPLAFSGGGEDGPEGREGLSTLEGSELHLHHPQGLFGPRLFVKGNLEVDEEAQDIVFELMKSDEQVMAGPSLGLAALRSLAGQAGQLAMIGQAFAQGFPVASMEGREEVGGQRCHAAGAGLIDRPAGFEKKVAHGGRPRLLVEGDQRLQFASVMGIAERMGKAGHLAGVGLEAVT